MVALQHQHYEAPDLRKQSDERYWNFLEMEFDPRGGGIVRVPASQTGRPHDSKLPPLTTLPNAEVRFTTLDGRPVSGARSLADGTVPVAGLVGIPRNRKLLLTAYNGNQAQTQVITTT